MSLWKKLFGGKAPATAEAPRDTAAASTTATEPDPATDPLEHLVWIEADANPSGLRCLDCRDAAKTFLSTTGDPAVADKFAALRRDDGRALATLHPEDAVAVPCALATPVPTAETRDGPLSMADTMEDKWDIFLFEGWLLFRRSWSGQLIYRASLHVQGNVARIETIEAPGEAAMTDHEFCIREVDFLVKSHLYNLAVPHPLPRDLQGDDRTLALFSFQRHGRRGLWATYGDTSAYDPWAKKTAR